MPIRLFTFDIPIDFVNTSGSTKQIKFVSSGNSDIVYDLNSSSTIIKKLNTGGGLAISNIATGINSAVVNGAKVINMSFGADAPALPSSDEVNAMQNAVNQGVILVVASGNSSLSSTDFW
mgnify:CR=1 FL=1